MINIKDTLFVRDRNRFDNVEKQANEQLVKLNSGQRVKDDIFRILKNINNLHLIKFPIDDNDLTAFKIENGKIFIYINSSLPLEKQIFGGAHELYHVLHNDDNSKEDLLKDYEKSFNDTSSLKEMEANSFAACFLVPKDQLLQEISKFELQESNIDILKIIMLMDIFAVPYKTMVLRLFECGIININIAERLLLKEDRNPKKDVLLLINQTRHAIRWQKTTEDEEEFSNLIEIAVRNYKEGIISIEQIKEDFKRIGINVDIDNFLEEADR